MRAPTILHPHQPVITHRLKTRRKTRAIAVQLSPLMVRRIDELAEKSKMSRHRYMILVLERAAERKVVLREGLAFSDEDRIRD